MGSCCLRLPQLSASRLAMRYAKCATLLALLYETCAVITVRSVRFRSRTASYLLATSRIRCSPLIYSSIGCTVVRVLRCTRHGVAWLVCHYVSQLTCVQNVNFRALHVEAIRFLSILLTNLFSFLFPFSNPFSCFLFSPRCFYDARYLSS